MKLTKINQQRFDAAKKLYQKIIDTSVNQNYIIVYDNIPCNPNCIRIGKYTISIVLGNTTYEMICANPEYDHGLEKTIAEFALETRQKIKLIKNIEY